MCTRAISLKKKSIIMYAYKHKRLSGSYTYSQTAWLKCPQEPLSVIYGPITDTECSENKLQHVP